MSDKSSTSLSGFGVATNAIGTGAGPPLHSQFSMYTASLIFMNPSALQIAVPERLPRRIGPAPEPNVAKPLEDRCHVQLVVYSVGGVAVVARKTW